MSFWNREDDLERELRARRPEPRPELVEEIARMVGRERPRRSDRPIRLGVAVAFSAAMLIALGAFGGLSYAANGVSHAVSSAVHAIAPAQPVKFVPAPAESSAMAQYKVAVCFHGHTLNIDSHAVHALLKNGATFGPCGGGAFKPNEALVVACFKAHNVSIAKTSANSKSKRAKLKKLGITLGYCKT